MTDKEIITINKFGKLVQENNVSDEFLVQFIELCFDFLNAETISNYAKKTGMSYNGVKNYRKTVEIRGVKFVIDNQ